MQEAGSIRANIRDVHPDVVYTERGKHAQALQHGYTIEIHQPDGTTVIEEVRPTEGVVVLDTDIREYFPDSRSVNDALRALVKLVPSRKKIASRKS